MKRSKNQEEARRVAQRRWLVDEHNRLARRAEEVETLRILLRKDAEGFGLVELLDELEGKG